MGSISTTASGPKAGGVTIGSTYIVWQEKLLRSDQCLMAVRYFTARLHKAANPEKQERQKIYLEALTTLSDLHIHYGYYVQKDMTCRKCSATWKTYEEKMTDVNIAVELLGDAHDDVFDTAIIYLW